MPLSFAAWHLHPPFVAWFLWALGLGPGHSCPQKICDHNLDPHTSVAPCLAHASGVPGQGVGPESPGFMGDLKHRWHLGSQYLWWHSTSFNAFYRLWRNTRVSLTCILMSAWRARSCDNVARGTNLGTMSVNLDTSTRKWASLSAGTVFLTHAPSCPYPHLYHV